MLRKFLPLAAVAFTMFTAPAYAAVVYDFTFDDSANFGGIVDGTVTLPSSADGTYTATSVVVTSNTGGTFPGVAWVNTWATHSITRLSFPAVISQTLLSF
jgi:hypothetical protein